MGCFLSLDAILALKSLYFLRLLFVQALPSLLLHIPPLYVLVNRPWVNC